MAIENDTKVFDSGITRRSVLLGAAAGFAATAGGFMMPLPAKAAPRKGGNLRFGVGGGSTSDTLDPRNWTDIFMYMIGCSVRGNLVEILADGSVAPELAESFEPSNGHATWAFHLRKGVRFSNGKPVTPEDVISTIDLTRKSHSASGMTALLSQITDIKADGGDTVVFTLEAGNIDFPFALADYTMGIMPFEDGKPVLDVGAGPYLLRSFQAGISAKLERNPDSFKQGNFDSVELISIADPVARQSALVSGEVDLINRVDPKTAQLLKRSSNIVVGNTPGRRYYAFTANGSMDPFTNVHVRQALKYGVEREELVKKILYGFGSVGNDQPISKDYRFHNPELAARSYDPDKARFHLKAAGLDKVDVKLNTADAAYTGAVDASVLYAEKAAKGGINITVNRTPNDGYWSQVWMKTPFFTSYWGGRPTEDAILTMAWSKASDSNESGMSDLRVEDLIKAARREGDEAKRRQIYGDIQQLISDEYSAVIPMFADFVFAANKSVVPSEHVSGVAEMDGARCLERWSFA